MRTPELSSAEARIYASHCADHGPAAADRWLKGYLERRSQSQGTHPSALIPAAAPECFSEPSEQVVRRETARVPPEETTESFSARQVARVAENLNPLALRIYALLNLIGCTVGGRRGYSRKAWQVSYFCPAEPICAHLGVTRGSFYRSLKELLALGLVDERGHKTTLKGRGVRCDGTLWSVKLLPHGGGRARLRYEDLKASYRDLEADIEAGNTAYAQTRQSDASKAKRVTLESLLTWVLPPVNINKPVTLTVAPDERLSLELLLDVPGLPKQGRRDGVDRAARALAQGLADHGSLDFYRYLLWRLLWSSEQGRDYLHFVYGAVAGAVADSRGSSALRPGALLVNRLKEFGLWEELKEALPVRKAGR